MISVLFSVVLNGCSSTGTEVTTNNNADQMTTTSSSNNNIAANPAETPPANMDNISAAPPNNSTPETNAPMTKGNEKTADKDKKSMPPKEMPTPVIGSGGQDFFLLTQVQGAYNTDKDLGKAVVVDVKEGNITLTGKVPSQELKEKAEKIARNVKGVKNVKNNLQVSP